MLNLTRADKMSTLRTFVLRVLQEAAEESEV
jgi:hypothetical protein